MATNKTDFSSYPIGSPPSDWVISWVTTSQTWAVRSKVGALGGKTLEHIASVDGRRFIYWSVPGSVTGDVEVLIKWRTTDSTLNNIPARAHIHTRGTSTQSSQYAYTLDLTMPSTLRLGRTLAGTFATIATGSLSFNVVPNTWYWFRLGKSGNTVRGKCWEDGTDEPISWDLSASDTNITFGNVGCGAFDFNGTRDFDFFSYGTAGDSAPGPTTDIASIVDAASDVIVDMQPFIGLPTINNIQSEDYGNSLVNWSLADILEIYSSTDGNLSIIRNELILLAVIFCDSSTQSNLLVNFQMQSIVLNQSNSQGLLLRNSDISGIITNQSTTNGNIALTIPLAGTIECQSAIIGDLKPSFDINSIIVNTSETIVDLTRLFSLQGITLGSNSILGSFSNLLNISVINSCSSIIEGTLLKYFAAQSTVSAASSIIVSMESVPPIDLASTITTQETNVTSLDLDLPISSTVILSSDVSGVVEIPAAMLLQSIVSIQSSTLITLNNTIPIDGSINLISDDSGVIEVVPPVDVAVIAAAQSSTLVALEDVIPVSSIVAASSSVSSSMIIVEPTYISSIASIQSNTVGSFNNVIGLSTIVAAAGDSSGTIVTVAAIQIQSITNAQSNTLGAIRNNVSLSGSVNCISSIVANIGHIIAIQNTTIIESLTESNITRLYSIQGSINIISQSVVQLTSGATQDLQSNVNSNLVTISNMLYDWILRSDINTISQVIARFEEDNWILKGTITGQSDLLGYLALVIATQINGSFIDSIDLNGSAINDISLNAEMENNIQIGGEF